MAEFYKILLLLFLGLASVTNAQITETTREISINPNQSTIITRFSAPRGYQWEKQAINTFGSFLVNFPLKPDNFPVRDYKNLPINKQIHHASILDIDVGDKDLQQCADAWMRLYGEFLWSQKRFDDIEFEFTSQQKMSWNDYKKGIRTTEVGDKVKFHKSAKHSDTYQNFREYMNLVFRYAGTISLDRESIPILKNADIRVGDIIIKPGSPGHSVFVVGSAKNSAGKRVFLLAESFMPAQDIHILKNPNNPNLSPWYELDVNAKKLITAKYIFSPVTIKRFHSIQ